ncbi:MAG: NFACT family protein, partial [Deltaproteobacteria bacterium]|nr:NFACT family protein [Deltaproteobacteria bacterium]
MGMSAAEIDQVLPELAELVGRRLDGAWQPARDRVVLGIAGEQVLLVPRGDAARIHRIAKRASNPPRPFSFQGMLRSHLGAGLVSIARLAGERAVVLDFGHFALHLRLTGRSGGLWLLVGGVPAGAHDGPATELPAFSTHVSRAEPTRFAQLPGPWGANRAAEDWFSRQEDEAARHRRRTAVLAAGRRELARSVRRLEHLEEDLVRSTRAGAFRAEADLLASCLHRVRKGATIIDVEDLEEEGRVIRIALDPGRTPAANLQALYNRAKRLERAAQLATVRRAATVQTIAALRRALEAAEREDDALGALERLVPRVTPRPDDPAALPWTRWVGPGGQEVLVGKHAAGNRRLTFQKARGNDWWMHLRDAAGAHL